MERDFEDNGYTAKCLGCKVFIKGTNAVGHSEEYRRREEILLEGTERSAKVKQKELDFYAEVLERDDNKRRRK